MGKYGFAERILSDSFRNIHLHILAKIILNSDIIEPPMLRYTVFSYWVSIYYSKRKLAPHQKILMHSKLKPEANNYEIRHDLKIHFLKFISCLIWKGAYAREMLSLEYD